MLYQQCQRLILLWKSISLSQFWPYLDFYEAQKFFCVVSLDGSIILISVTLKGLFSHV